MGIYNNTVTATAANPTPVLLIVDDEPGPRESLRMVFKDRYQCVIATSGRDGIAYARQHHVDAAVLDIRMPDLSGVEVLRELKQHDPHIECVMLTGYETIETARAAVQHGAADYLNKPFDVFAMRDIIARCMERRQQHLATRDKYQQLLDLNEELTRELTNYQRTATATAMSAGVVHELNNPLAIISAYAQMLGRDLETLRGGTAVSIEDLQNRLGKLCRELDRCQQLTRRFLRLARTNATEFENLSAASLLEDCQALLKAHPDRQKTELLIEPAPAAELALHTQPSLLLQVLLNLGINALQAINGTGTLRLSAQTAPLPDQCAFRSPSLDPTQPHIAITLADTGPGIAPALLEKIFTPYYTTKTNGNGLGLAIVADLVDRLQGAIQVESRLHFGTTFTVFLPAAR